jgi:hypothetical protein
MTETAVAVLEGQHRQLESLFDQVSSPDANRVAVLHTLLKEMAAHIAAERSAVHLKVKERGIGGVHLADDLLDDYQRMEKLMVLIERRKVNSPDLPDLVTDLRTATLEHIERARSQVAPALLGALSEQELTEMAEKITAADKVVISHPHPHLLSLGPLSTITTRLASRFDRLRDRTVNNRQPPAGPS